MRRIPVKFYLAASFASKPIIRGYREELQAIGHKVTSRWLDDEETTPNMPGAENIAVKDLADIDEASNVIFFTDVPSTTGGMHVEFGYALAQKKYLIVVGIKYSNIFQHECHLRYFSWNDFRKNYPL